MKVKLPETIGFCGALRKSQEAMGFPQTHCDGILFWCSREPQVSETYLTSKAWGLAFTYWICIQSSNKGHKHVKPPQSQLHPRVYGKLDVWPQGRETMSDESGKESGKYVYDQLRLGLGCYITQTMYLYQCLMIKIKKLKIYIWATLLTVLHKSPL